MLMILLKIVENKIVLNLTFHDSFKSNLPESQKSTTFCSIDIKTTVILALLSKIANDLKNKAKFIFLLQMTRLVDLSVDVSMIEWSISV